MTRQTFVHRSKIPAPSQELFRWHTRPGALERLTPPWQQTQVIARTGGVEDGSRVTLRMGLGPLRKHWIAEHRDYREGQSFRDIQVKGPFPHWEHTHSMEPAGTEASYLEDRIEYELPFGFLGRIIGGPLVKSQLDRMFSYRHRITTSDLETHLQKGKSPMKILITGSSGGIGSALIPMLTTGGHEVVKLVRSQPSPKDKTFYWNPTRSEIDPAGFEGVDAVVHLAGERINGRWTNAKKERILESRISGTRLLAETLANLATKPTVLVSASAVGYYGDRGDELLDESSEAGSGFLAEVCRQWEAGTAPAKDAGIRVVNLRLAPVLTPAAAPLSLMLTPFRLGLGGTLGSGSQYFPWIAIDDVVGAIHHATVTESLSGPVNVVAPDVVTNLGFTQTLAKVLGRPAFMRIPPPMIRLAVADLADEALLAGQRVEPKRLPESGYGYRLPNLEKALRHLLGK